MPIDFQWGLSGTIGDKMAIMLIIIIIMAIMLIIIIRAFAEENFYKYCRVLESDTIKQEEMKEKL